MHLKGGGHLITNTFHSQQILPLSNPTESDTIDLTTSQANKILILLPLNLSSLNWHPPVSLPIRQDRHPFHTMLSKHVSPSLQYYTNGNNTVPII